MLGPFQRTELLIGQEAVEKLKKSKVAVFGVGGVGSFAVEALARCAVGTLVLVDKDDVCITNINRQIHATIKTVGKPKVDVMAERIKDINPDCNVITYKAFYNKETANELLKDDYDYVIDAIDTVSSKIDLVVRCKEKNIPIISSMGAGNKLDPTKFEVADIYKTSVCPLAKVMRTELKKLGVKDLKVVYSKEQPIKVNVNEKLNLSQRKQIPASISFVPSVVGLIIAGEVIKDLIKKE